MLRLRYGFVLALALVAIARIDGWQTTSTQKGSPKVFLGLRTAQYHVKSSDLKNARDWYARILGIQPYFDESYYVGFNVGGFELGLLPDERLHGHVGSSAVYWGVSNIRQAFERLIADGAVRQGEIEDVGHDIKKVSVLDPFGNEFGVIENPHFGKE